MTQLISRSGDNRLGAADGLGRLFELLAFEITLFGSLRLGLGD